MEEVPSILDIRKQSYLCILYSKIGNSINAHNYNVPVGLHVYMESLNGTWGIQGSLSCLGVMFEWYTYIHVNVVVQQLQLIGN